MRKDFDAPHKLLTRHIVAPPQLSKEEIKEMENIANFTIQSTIATAVLLYLCTYPIHGRYWSTRRADLADHRPRSSLRHRRRFQDAVKQTHSATCVTNSHHEIDRCLGPFGTEDHV